MNDNVKGISQLGDYAFDMRTAAGFWRYDSQKKMLVYRQTLNSLGGDLGLGILEINCRPSLVSQQAVELSGSIGRVVYVVIDGVCYLPEDGALSPEAELITVKDSQGESLDDFALTIQTGEYYPQERNQSLNLLTITILVGLLLLVLSSCLFFFSISRLSGRIVRFSRYISSSFTEIPGAYTDPGHDELSLVVHNFNLMLERNSDLINQIKLEQLRQNEMAYQVLQAQIDPHFLYNTLESVRMMAEMKDEPEISDMIFSLSKLMRYSFSVNTGLVTVGDELDLVSQFLKVQKMRLGAPVQYQLSEGAIRLPLSAVHHTAPCGERHKVWPRRQLCGGLFVHHTEYGGRVYPGDGGEQRRRHGRPAHGAYQSAAVPGRGPFRAFLGDGSGAGQHK